jgi:cation diffusion facilitator CzcD-associated flavoprotein CzcO
VGGLWAFGNARGTPTAYRSLEVNTSKARVQFEDLPMPADFPEYTGHEQIAAYLESYVDTYGLRERITFDTGVERADLRPNGSWAVTLEGGDRRAYDALVVANGHHWDPRWPDPPFPGSFEGQEIHARDYVDPEGLEGKTVVVVGLGNSAVDIAVDVSRVAEKTILSARRGAHILPRRLLGRPLDQVELLVPLALRARFGGRLTGLALRAGYRLGRFPTPQAYGLPAPSQPFGHSHPTVSDDLYGRFEAGGIVARPNVAELAGREVRFEDGSSLEADLIIYCTGYRVSFPFLDPDLISAPGNDLPLFHRVFKPDLPSISFIGLAQPIGPTIRLVETQSKWVAAYLAGAYALPDREEMGAAISADRERLRRRFYKSPRHTMQVDFWPYLREIDRELRRGGRRAAARGYAPPLEAKVRREAKEDGGPALAVILPADRLETVRESLEALRAQTVAGRIELVVVGPATGAIEEVAEQAGFHSVLAVEHDLLPSLAAARAAGIVAARAPLVALAETHCFPHPEWAEALIETHRAPWAAVGPVVENENPRWATSGARAATMPAARAAASEGSRSCSTASTE